MDTFKDRPSEDQAAFDAIGFLTFELGVDRRKGTHVWLKEAGLWEPNLGLGEKL